MLSVGDQILQCPPRPILPMDRKWKPNIEHAPNCPRCASSNTKFCYYNNYSLSQPRYFCKGCRRYWTKGGSLRNVPVGGGCRKNRRSKSSRVAQSDRAAANSVSYIKNFTNNHQSSACPDADSMVHERPTEGSDIDLAVVFAKFLNQNASDSLNPDNNQSTGATPTTTTSSREPELLQEMPDQVLVGGSKLLQQEENNIEELLETEMNSFGTLQNLLGDEMVQDALWSDHHDVANAITTPSFTWQPMVQLQEFDSFPGDDLLRISANLVTDNWSNSFDSFVV